MLCVDGVDQYRNANRSGAWNVKLCLDERAVATDITLRFRLCVKTKTPSRSAFI